jgi:hypothetical protein
VIIRADFPVQSAIELAHHEVAVTFILHELLETVQLQPTNPLSFKHLVHNLVTTAIQDSTSRKTAAIFAQSTEAESMPGIQDVASMKVVIMKNRFQGV